MDWTGAIETNRAALTRVVAEIFVLLRLVLEGSVTRLPRRLYLEVEGLLRPDESALRRLIVVASRGLKVTLPAPRPRPKDLVIVASGIARVGSFQLFDTRKTLTFDTGEHIPFCSNRKVPHIYSLETFLQSRPVPPEADFDATRLCRRFASLKHALETLPQQAKRMARWRLRRAIMESPKFRSPLRPGWPPGINQRARTDIQDLLRECHSLADYALRLDSS